MRVRRIITGSAGLAVAALALVACDSGGGSDASRSASPARSGDTASASASRPSSASGTGSTEASTKASTAASGGAAFNDPALVRTILGEATKDFGAVNSYSYRTLAASRSDALAATTGSFTAQYRKTFDSVITPQAKKLRATQDASVVRIGLVTASADTARVIVFGTLRSSTSSRGRRADPATVTLTLQPEGGRWLIAGEANNAIDPVAGRVPGNADLVAAVAAARDGAHALTALSRATFAADYAKAAAMTTGALRHDFLAKRATTQAALRKGGFDLDSDVGSGAVASADGQRVTVLIALNAYKVVEGDREAPTAQRLVLTLVPVQGRWLLDDLASVGTS